MSNWIDFFDELHRIFRQTSQLLQDVDALMGEAGFKCSHKVKSQAGMKLSYKLDQPDLWYPRWISRFYTKSGVRETAYVAVVLSDQSKGGDWTKTPRTSSPIVTMGVVVPKEGKSIPNNHYWLTKHWFWLTPDGNPNGEWHEGGENDRIPYMESISTSAVPIEPLKSREDLAHKVTGPLLAKLATRS